jgi:putative Ca2+/H+ antiporter (TMEM165/GDT1 family)
MNWAFLATVFGTVFLAEIGDKTQLATLLYASDSEHNRWHVFLASSAALVVAAGIGVLLGAALGKAVPQQALKWAAGIGFIAIGVWTVVQAWSAQSRFRQRARSSSTESAQAPSIWKYSSSKA